jgi:hypothetical protein
MRPGVTMQQNKWRPFAAVPDAQRYLSEIDELELKPFEEAHAKDISQDVVASNP